MLRNAAAAQNSRLLRDVRRWDAPRGIERSRAASFSLYVRTVSWQTTHASIAIARIVAHAYIDFSVW
jgi:hypothetical protein